MYGIWNKQLLTSVIEGKVARRLKEQKEDYGHYSPQDRREIVSIELNRLSLEIKSGVFKNNLEREFDWASQKEIEQIFVSVIFEAKLEHGELLADYSGWKISKSNRFQSTTNSDEYIHKRILLVVPALSKYEGITYNGNVSYFFDGVHRELVSFDFGGDLHGVIGTNHDFLPIDSVTKFFSDYTHFVQIGSVRINLKIDESKELYQYRKKYKF